MIPPAAPSWPGPCRPPARAEEECFALDRVAGGSGGTLDLAFTHRNGNGPQEAGRTMASKLTFAPPLAPTAAPIAGGPYPSAGGRGGWQGIGETLTSRKQKGRIPQAQAAKRTTKKLTRKRQNPYQHCHSRFRTQKAKPLSCKFSNQGDPRNQASFMAYAGGAGHSRVNRANKSQSSKKPLLPRQSMIPRQR